MMKTSNINVSIDSLENPIYNERELLEKELEKTKNEILELMKEKVIRLEKELGRSRTMQQDSFEGKILDQTLLNE